MTKGYRPFTKQPARGERQRFLTAAVNHPVTDPNACRWQDLAQVSTGLRQHILGAAPLVDFHRSTAASAAFDLLRTRLMQTIKQHGWSRIAVTAPTYGAGSTFTAVNLALSLSRVPSSRTILMDMNMRKPGVAHALDMDGRGQIAEFLRGDVPMASHMVRVNDTLALGLTRDADDNAAECLHDPRTARTLARMHTALQPDVVLYDLPPVLAHDDVPAFLPQVDGVLLISDGSQTEARHLAECERILEGQTRLLGVILNRARASSIESYS